MLLQNMLRTMGAAAADKLMVEDVFSAYTYTGNGSTQTINNGIDLAGKGGMVWCKRRNGANNHSLVDTERGMTYAGAAVLASEQTSGTIYTLSNWMRADSTGFSLGTAATGSEINSSGNTYVAWTFRRAPKFFDVVTWTGNGVNNRHIPHGLGCTAGMIVVKRFDYQSNWVVRHATNGSVMYLNTTDKDSPASIQEGGYPSIGDGDTFMVGSYDGHNISAVNEPGATYIAYLWAHDDSADGVVQCGSFTTDASGNATVSLGLEPQYVLAKSTTVNTDWYVYDASRGFTHDSSEQMLYPNRSAAENGLTFMRPISTGFYAPTTSPNATYIYLAIRRGPMRTPTDGTKVYNAIARTGTGAAATVTGVGFAPDAVICSRRSATETGTRVEDRLRGATQELVTESTTAETAVAQSITGFDVMDGFKLGTDTDWNASGGTFINQCFRRAPGFFDQVCYTGTGVARTIAHNLKSVPGMIWVKCRSSASYDWYVYHKSIGAGYYMRLNYNYDTPPIGSSALFSAEPSASEFSLGTSNGGNNSSNTYTAYLFGDTPGLCKAFSYTGNGSNQDIALGFAPRFVLIKRTDAAGDWKICDSSRGIVSGNDPVLALNSAAAEVTTTDPIDPIANGFNITQEATNNLNVNAATYIGWACV